MKFVQLVVRLNPFLIQNFETTLKRLLQVCMNSVRRATSSGCTTQSVQRALDWTVVRWSHLTLAAPALEFYDDAAALKLALLTALCFGQKMSVQVGSEYCGLYAYGGACMAMHAHARLLVTMPSQVYVNHNPSKTDVRPPNFSKMKVHELLVTFWKRPLDGLWLIALASACIASPAVAVSTCALLHSLRAALYVCAASLSVFNLISNSDSVRMLHRVCRYGAR